MGTCTGVTSVCSLGGYAMETQCVLDIRSLMRPFVLTIRVIHVVVTLVK
jgi:putative lipase involved disintegration of autophagic bodies